MNEWTPWETVKCLKHSPQISTTGKSRRTSRTATKRRSSPAMFCTLSSACIFVLKITHCTFQRVGYGTPLNWRWKYALVYFDDIVLFSKSVEEHKSHSREVLFILPTDFVNLKLKKCLVLEDVIDFLVHVIRPAQLKVSQHATYSISGPKDPTTITKWNYFWSLYGIQTVRN